MKFALATANKGKIKEIKDILSNFGYDVLSREDLGINMEIEETGCDFYENALIKAAAICDLTGLPSIADDSGLCIDGLNGAPGLYSSSFGGINLSDTERVLFLLKTMENMEQRSAKFVCNIVCLFPNGDIISSIGECFGEILRSPKGENGFGYDPVFRARGFDKSMAELSLTVKNEISHRGKALYDFSAKLYKYINYAGKN